MVFPKSNLSTAAQPWGRFVEKSITNLETTVATERVNNAARDAQASLSIKRLDQSVTAVAAATVAAQQAADDAQAAIDGLTSLGSIDSEYTINAGNINAGTLTGVTVQTGASGTRAVMSGSDIKFYNTTSYAGSIVGSTGPDTFPVTEVRSPNNLTKLAVADDYVAIKTTSNSAYVFVGDNDVFIGSSTPVGTVSLEASTFFMEGATFNSGTNTTVNGAFIANGSISLNSSATVSGNLSTDGALTRTALAGGGSTTATINNSGQFVRTTSSARYKQDIQPLEVDYDELLSLEPKRFRLKEEAAEDDNARFYAGFIAEEIDATSLKDFVGYSKQEDGSVIPESVYYAEMTAALLAGLKKQDSMIKELQAQVAELQSKVQ